MKKSQQMKLVPSRQPLKFSVDERDLRLFLSDGFVAAPDAYPKGRIRSLAHDGKTWTPITSGMEIPVASDAKPCVMEIDLEVSSEENPEYPVFPSSAIIRVLFKTDTAREDFKRRNSVIPGLATSHFEYTIDADLQFHIREGGEEDQTDSPDESDVSFRSSAFDKSNRSVGSLAAILASGTRLPRSVLDIISQMSGCNQKLILECLQDLCENQNKDFSESFEFVLDTLSDKRWSDGFDPIVMLDYLTEGLDTHGISPASLATWTKTCRNVLENQSEADPELLKDGKNYLLRSLLLILRTTPLSVDSIEDWNTIQPSPGPGVMACSLMLAGWYQGFAQQGKAKKDQALYRFASKALAASIGENPSLNPKLDLISADEGETGVRTYTLRESEEAIATTSIYPNPSLMEALFATKKVALEMGSDFTVKLDIENSVILVHSAKQTVWATYEDNYTIRWNASWTWPGKGKLRTWKPDQYKAIAWHASQSSCCLYTTVFPKCRLHTDQLIATMDHAEIEFQLKGIFNTLERLENYGLEDISYPPQPLRLYEPEPPIQTGN